MSAASARLRLLIFTISLLFPMTVLAFIPAPEDLHVRNAQTYQTLFRCGDDLQVAPADIDLYLAWATVYIEERDPPVQAEGYHHQIFSGTSCAGEPLVDSWWSTAEGEPPIISVEGGSWHVALMPSPGVGNYCWRVEAWVWNPWSGGSPYIPGDWSDCCCFEVGGQPPLQLPTPVMEGVDDRPCGSSTSNNSPLLRWSDIAQDDGYRWEVQDVSQNPVDSGTTGPNVNVALVDSLTSGDYTARVQARGDGVSYSDSEWSADCPFTVEGTVEEAVDFTWWPEQPKQGERVRFADLSSPRPLSWSWNFSDGSLSNEQHPSHVFPSTGQFNVILEAEFASGIEHIQKALTVSGVVQCGDDACDSGETAWSCPYDCGLLPEETGRAGGSDRRPTVPAVAGAVHGVYDVWFIKGSIFNPETSRATFVIECLGCMLPPNEKSVALTGTVQAGPFKIEPGHVLYWDDLIPGLFSIPSAGSLRIDAELPLQFQTLTQRKDARDNGRGSKGTVAQASSGIRERLTLGEGDGAAYLIGLRQDDECASTVYFQEIDGESIILQVDAHDDGGALIQESELMLQGSEGRSLSLADFGVHDVESAYIAILVIDGAGRLAVSGAVTNLKTGDVTTVPAMRDDVSSKSDAPETHEMIAVVSHTKSEFSVLWRSTVIAMNPTPITQTARLIYEPEFLRPARTRCIRESIVTIPPHHQIMWNDFLAEEFRLSKQAQTQGALHIYHSGDLLFDSRAINVLNGGGVMAANLPALRAGDLITAGDTGFMIGLSSSPLTRTHIGISEFSGQEATVRVVLLDAADENQELGKFAVTVPAHSHVQIPKIFEKIGLGGTQRAGVIAKVTVESGGLVYAYGMTINKQSGDPTSFLTTKN